GGGEGAGGGDGGGGAGGGPARFRGGREPRRAGPAGGGGGRAAPPQDAVLAEPLTERELAVLHLLGGTLSLREIGQEMQVSANTVKTHTQAIYRKLGVSARSDAVAAARQMGL